MKFNYLILLSILLIRSQLLSQSPNELPPFAFKDTLFYNAKSETDILTFIQKQPDSTLLLIDEGDYYTETGIWINGLGKEIRGVGKVSILCASYSENVLWISGAKQLKIRNLHLTHSLPDSTGGIGCTGHVVYIGDAKDVHIDHCDINGCGVTGIFDFGNNENIIVSNSHIHNNSLAAFVTWDLTLVDTLYNYKEFSFYNNISENNGHGRYVNFNEDFFIKGFIIGWDSLNFRLTNFIPDGYYDYVDSGKFYRFYDEEEDLLRYPSDPTTIWEFKDDYYSFPNKLKCTQDTTFLIMPSVIDVAYPTENTIFETSVRNQWSIECLDSSLKVEFYVSKNYLLANDMYQKEEQPDLSESDLIREQISSPFFQISQGEQLDSVYLRTELTNYENQIANSRSLKFKESEHYPYLYYTNEEEVNFYIHQQSITLKISILLEEKIVERFIIIQSNDEF